MNTNIHPNGYPEPIDAEIERDVAELRGLLAKTDTPTEPHPAYWQNFVVHVHSRIDGERAQRRRWSLMTRFASVGAAALVVALAVNGVLVPNGDGLLRGSKDPVAQQQKLSSNPMAQRITKGESIILSSNDVQMLNAILDEDDDGIFKAIVANGEM